MRWLIVLFATIAGLQAATLERLTMDEMIAKSTQIVRAKVVSSRAAFRGPVGPGSMIYTWYGLQVSEWWKGGSGQSRFEVAVPGGNALSYRQTIPGAPALVEGQEYVLFVWTSRSGLPQIIGLTQGLFTMGGAGGLHLSQASSSEPMVDARTHKAVSGAGMTYTYAELKAMVAGARASK